jgi:hypothetical protein
MALHMTLRATASPTRRPGSVSHLRHCSSALQLPQHPTAVLLSTSSVRTLAPSRTIARMRRWCSSLPMPPPSPPRPLRPSPAQSHHAVGGLSTRGTANHGDHHHLHAQRRRWTSLVAGAFIRFSRITSTLAKLPRRALGPIPHTIAGVRSSCSPFFPSRGSPPLPRRTPRPTSSRCGNSCPPRTTINAGVLPAARRPAYAHR